MNTLSDFGRWGSNLLGEASNQLASAGGTATSYASSTFKSGTDLVRSGAKTVTKTVGSGLRVSAKHVLDDPRGGKITVSEVCHLADGGFGAVVKVKDESGREYAMKTIACQEGLQIASSLEAARTEVSILSNLAPHANIIRCFGSSEERMSGGSGHTIRLLLELCPCGTLMDYMDKKDGKLGAKDVVTPFLQVVEAVKFLHSQKPPIQHRDLKVENVLQGSDGDWKLCDFGSCSTSVVPPQEFSRARLLSLQEEIDKTVTMLYRPPEMADIDLNYRNGFQIDTQVDLWMLGCILYTLAFYQHPFQDCPTAMAITNGKYFIPYDKPLGKSLKLCGLIHWLLAKNPNDRPNAARLIELVKDIGKIQYDDLFAMMPEAVKEKIRKLDALFSKRKDTGDMVLPPAAAALVAKGAIKVDDKSSQQQRRPSDGSSSGYPSNGSKRPSNGSVRQETPSSTSGNNVGGFDLLSALAPTEVSSVKSAPSSAPSNSEDLLSFNLQPNPTPASGGAGFGTGDLLGFGSPEPVATSSAPVATDNDWCDFQKFAPAPSVVPVQASTSTNPGAVSTCDLIGFDFVDPLAPSPALANGSSRTAPIAENCKGAARTTAPQSASVNLLDF
jgi:AP2-associated kinase|mmetsp:Transcript_30156/g.48644  ORF Transcript_30156/g.48644 Transcript_30156/m.48644 type:complete len:613 (-) Transcript_30156:72-1910(-)